MEGRINSTIEVVKKALAWEKNVKESDPYIYRRNLIDIHRELDDLRFAVSENCSVAAFGESQMGKSYLISALLSDPGMPFLVKAGDKTYNFIDEINPSEKGSSVEATGVVTRFSATAREQVPNDYLKISMLSVADIVLVLAEAYYIQVNRRRRNAVETVNHIARRIKECPIQSNNVNPILTEADVAYIEDYLSTSVIGVNCNSLSSDAGLFPFLIKNVRKISNDDIASLLTVIWEENESFNRLFRDLLTTYRQLNYQLVNYVEFKSVLKKHGSLLDVARLDEMYSSPEAVGDEYVAEAMVKLTPEGQPISVKKSFLSALIAELGFCVEKKGDDRVFLDYLDLLDFPGLRPDQKRDEERLDIGKNLTTVYRRGKVTYLFNKYSKTKRIGSLLFCHNHNQSNQCTMGPVLQDWVKKNVGATADERGTFVKTLGASPLFVISTWFNKDLEYNDETVDADLNLRWDRRFKTVLSKEVLQCIDEPEHWFNKWTNSDPRFRNLFVLRDFTFSKTVFRGYDKDTQSAETEAIDIPKYPNYLEDLRRSFLGNDFVLSHFADPEESWANSATPRNDGTRLIIRELNKLAPNAHKARKEKFDKDLARLKQTLHDLLWNEYHPENTADQVKKAKREAARIILNIDSRLGDNPYFFGELIEAMMVPNTMIYEVVFDQINGNELDSPMSDQEGELFMAAGLDTNASKEENLRRLCVYLGGLETLEECVEVLEPLGIDVNKLLKKNQMVQSRAEQLVNAVESVWRSEFLKVKVANQFKETFPLIDILLDKLFVLYDDLLHVHSTLTKEVQRLMDTIREDKLVGIVADYLTMSFNKFITSFGFAYMKKEEMDRLLEDNNKYQLGFDVDLIKDYVPSYGVDLLTKLDEVSVKLRKKEYTQGERMLQMSLPRYRNRWQWQHRLRAAFAATCKIPNWNIEENDRLKKIIDSLEKIQ